MGKATAVSDIERAEHLNYADGAGVKRVSVYNDGAQINAATEETLQAIQSAVTNPVLPTGASTEAKQDSQITLLTERLGDLNIVLRDMMNVISNPAYVDKSANAVRNQIVSGTVTTVTTVTGMTNIDGYQGKSLMISSDAAAWAQVVRSRIS